jgi:hypothetical protein
MDDAGTSALTSLADGTEVEILAWRPRGAVGTRYRVRLTRGGLEGWLESVNLRPALSALVAVRPEPAPPTVTATPLRGRR